MKKTSFTSKTDTEIESQVNTDVAVDLTAQSIDQSLQTLNLLKESLESLSSSLTLILSSQDSSEQEEELIDFELSDEDRQNVESFIQELLGSSIASVNQDTAEMAKDLDEVASILDSQEDLTIQQDLAAAKDSN